MKTLPEGYKIVEALEPQAGAALTADYVSLKNINMAYIYVHINQAEANTVAMTIEQATAVDGSGSIPITVDVPIWANQDCDDSDTLVRQTDAVSFTSSAAQKQKHFLFQVDPRTLANGFDCLTVKTGASASGNITSATYLLETKYAQATPPAAITD